MLGGVRNRSSTVIVKTAGGPVEVARQEMKALLEHGGDRVELWRAAQERIACGTATTPAAALSYRRAGATFRTRGLREVLSGLAGAFFGLGRTTDAH